MADITMTDISSLFDQHTEDSFVDEASRFPTVPGGLYEAKIDQREVYEGGTNSEWKDTFERQYARVSFPAARDGKKLGRVSFNLSWEEKRGTTGRQDRLFQSYNQIKGALGLKGKSVGDVLTGMMEQPLAYVVQELYQGDKGENGRTPWLPVTEENRKQVNEAGRRLINTLNGVRPIKA